ncbi:MAG: hypothetical protein GY946_21970 [bacterium]|nr:hypothetical protein [bacterium]
MWPFVLPRDAAVRARAEREAVPKQPAMGAINAMRLVAEWETELREGSVRRADLARRHGWSRARITQLMTLLDLPDDVRRGLLEGASEFRGWSIRRALTAADCS